MEKIHIQTISQTILSDLYTPIGIYLKIRDKFRDSILLESSEFLTNLQNYSFIGVNAIAGIEVSNYTEIELKYPLQNAYKKTIQAPNDVNEIIWDFFKQFSYSHTNNNIEKFAQGFYGYLSYDSVPFFENIQFQTQTTQPEIPLIRFRLYQFIIVFNHFKSEMYIIENKIEGVESNIQALLDTIYNKEVPLYPFKTVGHEMANISSEDYLKNVEKGIKFCKRGDVFQIVLSRRFMQKFEGDEINIYRQLRSINPSPYLFYLDYGNYRLFGSSPEAQLIIKDNIATIHPIAGTTKRTGNIEEDKIKVEQLLIDPKENAEHIMLVDLARNDLSIYCNNVRVEKLREVQYFSHVIHLVSEVKGTIKQTNFNPFHLIAKTFPAGTLSGAPKYKAMELIDKIEQFPRSFYGGAVGFIGLDGTCNLAIIIRSFLSKENTLHYQAGGGVVASSLPENELQEINNKLNALKQAIQKSSINPNN